MLAAGTVAAALVLPGLPTTGTALADPVIAAAGDIACDPASSNFNGGSGSSSSCRQKYTSDLLVNAGLSGVLLLGDNQYYCGGYSAFLQSYDLSWGRVKSITHPSVGNHEYLTSGGTGCNSSNAGAAGYFDYFNGVGNASGPAGARGSGYYSYNVGSWHLIALNTNCSSAGGCSASSPQGKWLAADLAANKNMCTLAYWHIPLFSSGGRANSNSRPFWDQLYAADADLILAAHDHTYERFAPQRPDGTRDTSRGIREFIVGTGGANHTSFVTTAANSEVRNSATFGVMLLTLHPSSYDWYFKPEAGKTFTDSGTTACHGSGGTSGDTIPPSTPQSLVATAPAGDRVELDWSDSTDNVGVTGYRVYRNGSEIARPTSSAYTDTTVQPSTTYSYYVRAEDAAGNLSAQSNTATVTTPASTSTVLTFAPAADATIYSAYSSTNYGTRATVEVDGDPVKNFLMKFSVTGVGTRGVASAKLSVYAVDPSDSGGQFRSSGTSWSETTVNWGNAPAAGATIVGSLGSVSSNQWYEVDVSSLVTGDGVFSFRVTPASTNGADYASRESGANAPKLVVTLK
jgi:chitodextrinase